MHLEVSSVKWRPSYLGLNVLKRIDADMMAAISQTGIFKFLFINENFCISNDIWNMFLRGQLTMWQN